VTKVIDFDAFRAEQKAEPVSLKIGGRDYPLPSALPASMALDIIRRTEDNASEEIEGAELLRMGEEIFGGKGEFDALLRENKVTLTELPELFKMVFAAYNGASEDPNPESPASTETTSSL
jgi:hypothetical protein